MTYSSTGPKPFERASKSSHHYIINDPVVASALKGLSVPEKAASGQLEEMLIALQPTKTDIEHIVAVDGGYTETAIQEGYPSATIHFFQFGALHFKVEHLLELETAQHIAPEDMQRLKNIDRIKFAIPTRGARRKDSVSLCDSVRKAVFEFLAAERLSEDISLLDTLAWFVFRRYKTTRTQEDGVWTIASNPYGVPGSVLLDETQMSKEFTFACPKTGKVIYLSDVFRLHERIEEETGAAGVAGYIAGAVEHLILLHVIRNLLRKHPGALEEVLFIIDRPTGWFGLTAPMHKLMLELDSWLFDNHNLYLAGLEKSGAFVEHAAQIQTQIPPGSILLLNDHYIYRHISPGEEDPNRPYAATSYYGHKVFLRARNGQIYVVSLPVRSLHKKPKAEDIPNLHAVLTHVEQLHCDMFENALLPVALVNKLVSLSAHPSSQILKSFAKATVS